MADYQLTQTGEEVQTALDKVVTTALTTTATNLSGAVNELDSDLTSLSGTVTTLSGVANSKVSPLTYATITDLNSNFDAQPTSASQGTYTFTDDGWLYIYATRGSTNGYTLNVLIDNTVRFDFPAYDAYAVVDMLIPVVSGQVLKFTTDSASATWTLRKVQFMR